MRNYILALSAAAALSASAQFNQSIAVEGKYVPEVFRLERINTFPRQVKFSLESTPLNYDTKSVPALFAPSLLTMPATGWRDTRSLPDSKGYLDLSAGSWLNSNLSAGYKFINSDKTTLGIRLQHNSTSLWRPRVGDMLDFRQFRYDETLGIYGSRLFPEKGRLDAAAQWHIGCFNYYGYGPIIMIPGSGNTHYPKDPTQTLNDVAFRASWTPAAASNINWKAQAGIRYFGYRALYNNNIADIPTADLKDAEGRGGRETDIDLAGFISGTLSESSSAGMDMNADILLMPHSEVLDDKFNPQMPDNYGILYLTPYYSFSRENLIVRVGAKIDLSFNAGNEEDFEGNKYSFFHIAPDIRADYQAGPAALYLHLGGGTRLNTLASNYEFDYYQCPFIQNSTPIHSPLDAKAGVSFGPFSGFAFGADFAFRVSKKEYLGGWYMYDLNNKSDYAPDRSDIHGFSIGAHASYDLGRIIRFSASGSYQPQKGKTGYFNGFDRPKVTALLSAETNPWSSLKLKLEYDFRGMRGIYRNERIYGSLNDFDFRPEALRLRNVAMLNFGASYRITPKFNIHLQADNLLCRHVDILPSQPSQGLVVTAGFGILF